MSGSVLVCAMLAACAAPVPPGQAPAPRVVKPDVSLIVSDYVDGKNAVPHFRVLRVGFHNGKPLPAEVICACDEEGIKGLAGGDVRAGRYFVSLSGSVIDLREKKIINAKRDGVVVHTDDTKMTYWIEGGKREGLYAFEYATGKQTRREKFQRFLPAGVPHSPDGAKAIDWSGRELTLYRDDQKPKSLGTGFKIDSQFVARGNSVLSLFPVLWLDDNQILVQRGAGKLVTVSLDGKVTPVLTIKDVPEDAETELIRDGAGSIVYSSGQKKFRIDLAKKTATPTDWRGLGHGFEVAWEKDEENHSPFRHNGKDIGRIDICLSDRVVSAPGYLAVPHHNQENCHIKFAVWSLATGEWTVLEYEWVGGVFGWIK